MIVALFSNIQKKGSKVLSIGVKEFLNKHNITVVASDENAEFLGIDSLSSVNHSTIDVLISIGGDGTILRLIHDYPDLQAPIFAINMGGLGFMADNPIADVYTNLQKLVDGDYTIEERIMMHGSTTDGEICFAVNEMVIHRAKNPNIVDLALHVNGKYLNTFSADGIIISTPNGSTAYSLAAGGPIISPELEAFVITPICPHTISNRPLVFSPDHEVQIRYLSHHEPVEITFDGISRSNLSTGEAFSITRSEKKFRLISLESHDYFATLREKLGWVGKLR